MIDDPVRLLDNLRQAQATLASCGTPLNSAAQRILTRIMLASLTGETVTQKALAEELGIAPAETSRLIRILERGGTSGLGGLVSNHAHRGRPSVVTLAPLGQDLLTELLTTLNKKECPADAHKGSP